MNDPIERFGGLDWATDEHVVAVVDAAGQLVDEFAVTHTNAGVTGLCRRLGDAGVGSVAIERPDGPVVDALLAAGFEVVVVTSRSVKSFRARYGMAGNKSDRSDAFVLADCLRTDGHRWVALTPDSPATVTLRSHVRARKELVVTRVAVANQLRAHLELVFPGAVSLFADLDSGISLAFLARFPSSAKAEWLSEKRLEHWLSSQHYTGGKSAAVLMARLARATRGASCNDADGHGTVTRAFVDVLVGLRHQIHQLEDRIKVLLDAHPDGAIFRSFPRAGTIRAASLLAEIGDCRARFPDPESLAGLAGVVPSTRASGKRTVVGFRWAANKHLRDALCDFAGDSWRGNDWARHRYTQLRADGKRHPHAERILARTWAHIIWRCWQDHTPYNPDRHGGLQRLQHATA